MLLFFFPSFSFLAVVSRLLFLSFFLSVGPAAALRRRAQWLSHHHHHHAHARHPAMDDDDDEEEEDMDDDDDEEDMEDVTHEFWELQDQDSAMESLAMEMNRGRRAMERSRERFLEGMHEDERATRASSNRRRQQREGQQDDDDEPVVPLGSSSRPPPSASVARTPPQELLQLATLHASTRPLSFQWWQPATVPGHHHNSNNNNNNNNTLSMQIQQNLVHVPRGAGEGRAIRVNEPLPYVLAGNAYTTTTTANTNATTAEVNANNHNTTTTTTESIPPSPPQRNIIGFRVAFDLPSCQGIVGSSLGGNYLVGVTTTAFSSFHVHNGLQNTPLFYGIDDSGKKYQGPARRSTAGQGGNDHHWNMLQQRQQSRRAAAGGGGAASSSSSSNTVSPYATLLSPRDVTMNEHGVLFGNRQVITVVVNLDEHTMTFWRDETLLGTLVTNLPTRIVKFFPIVVPYHPGATCIITSLSDDPLPLLLKHAEDCQLAERRAREALHGNLLLSRKVMVRRERKKEKKSQAISHSLTHSHISRVFFVLLQIRNGEMTKDLRTVLTSIFAQYSKQHQGETLVYTEACRLYHRCGLKLSILKGGASITLQEFLAVVERICAEDEAKVVTILPCQLDVQIGDYVELVEGYDKLGDAAGGPLQLMERGLVVDLQHGANGELKSIRVLHNFRRWWYQPQAVQSERSGLVETPAVWFLKRVLRAHGYEHARLVELSKLTRAPPCQVGDVVKPRKVTATTMSSSNSVFAHVVTDTTSTSDPFAPRSRVDHLSVTVEFVDCAFAEATGLVSPVSSESAPVLETRRVRHSKVSFCSCAEIVAGCPEQTNLVVEMETTKTEENDVSPVSVSQEQEVLSDRLQSELAALSRFDRVAIATLTRECKRAETLAALFSCGLPEAILSAIDVAERQMNSLEPREDLLENISLLGNLFTVIANKLFGNDNVDGYDDDDEDAMAMDVVATEAAETHVPPPPQQQRGGASLISRRLGLREMMLARQDALMDDDGPEGGGGGPAGALQQRRNMLLSLLNQARRHRNAGNSNAEYDAFLAMNDFEMIMPPFSFGSAAAGVRAESAAPFGSLFGVNAEANNESNSPSNRSAGDRFLGQEGGLDQEHATQSSYLDSILRCRAEKLCDSLTGANGATQIAFVHHLVDNGLWSNSLQWIKASVDAQAKKAHLTTSQTNALILRDAVDEEETSLLDVAVSFGCSAEILNFLLTKGAQVTVADVQKAAITQQPKALALLLQHTSSNILETLDTNYSPEIIQVFEDAKARQMKLQQKMRDEAGTFMVTLAQRLIHFGLLSCRRHSSRIELFSRVLGEVFIGNVLLKSLRKAQRAKDSTTVEEADASETVDDFSPRGLLGSFPLQVLGDTLLSEERHLIGFLSLIEDYLCRKSFDDASAGLTFLRMLLVSFPFLRNCSVVKRYGLAEFVSLHLQLITRRLSELTKKVIQVDGTSSTGPMKSFDKVKPICCPGKHTAAIHVTRHSSFKCDTCGAGVERGRPMYGCRDCDWDACESCTDKAESGIVKCKTIKKIAEDCLVLLSETAPDGIESSGYTVLIAKLNKDDSSEVLQDLLIRLHNRDVYAIHDIGNILLQPGHVSIHQFHTIVLPSLYMCLDGQDMDETQAASARRKKKARMVGTQLVAPPTECSPEEKLQFAKQVVRLLFSGDASVLEPDSVPFAARKETDGAGSHTTTLAESRSETKTATGFTCSEAAQEVLRRCHQLLGLYEDVTSFANLFNEKGANSQSTELSFLTKPISIKLVPVASPGESNKQGSFSVFAEPLTPISFLQAQVLRSRKINDLSYVSFAQQLAEDRAIIVERGRDNTSGEWRICMVCGFDEKNGMHTVRYTSGWNGQAPALVEMSFVRSFDDRLLKFDEGEYKIVALAAHQYYILCRPGKDGPVGTASKSETESQLTLRESSPSSPESLPPLVSRQAAALRQNPRQRQPENNNVVLKRTWSALSLADAMRPVDLRVTERKSFDINESSSAILLQVRNGTDSTFLHLERNAVEVPPSLLVTFSSNQKLHGHNFSGCDETTMVSALKQLFERHDMTLPGFKERACQLFYSISIHDGTPRKLEAKAGVASTELRAHGDVCRELDIRARNFRSLGSKSSIQDDMAACDIVCDGLDETSIQCMKVLSLLCLHTQDGSILTRNESYDSLFVNPLLTKKLMEQLDDAVPVVGKALPAWCVAAPSFAPKVFSYGSRRALLERGAFGISRSVLKQQEAKVDVSRLRQRMHALRARAVELVGEAFSGGAEDPTALQLQADELYGMEEALASRVRAAFRAAKWQEYSLQVAKALIRRNHLLADATATMELYANDPNVFHRRLEIRFEGESGFDLASGNEAGVTRGFYADVAESLLSTENVASVYSASACPDSSLAAKMDLLGTVPMDIDITPPTQHKLPIWIPDLDASGLVVIPTPRADESSGLGVFPRPLPAYHPFMPEILRRFRFIGRLFAAATRDGFVFPLPISPSFLKLVQHVPCSGQAADNMVLDQALTSQDLPRAGFLGGEIYATEAYICRALDAVDSSDPPLSRFEQVKRYKEIATDSSFARIALGKSYDCSFEDYFQDRCFVDPFDPAQDESSMPLCPKGESKRVTIYNVREWVALAKKFTLHDGVVQQACAFRAGVTDFFSADYLSLFTPEEVHRDICGGGDGVDKWDESAVRKLFKLDGGKGAAEALVAVAAIGGEGGNSLSRRFGPTSPTIGFLVKALLEATPQQRRQFLSFVTSVPIETPGRIEVVPLVSPNNGEFLPMKDPNCLPRANTCARRLYLPKFESYEGSSESFKEVFWAVVREESRFKGFYEWRG